MPVTRTVSQKRALKDSDKITPQGRVVMSILEKGPIERSKLVAAVEKKMDGKTVQKAATIVAFQLTELKKAGLVKVDVSKTDKPAKAKKAAKKTVKKDAEAPATPAAD